MSHFSRFVLGVLCAGGVLAFLSQRARADQILIDDTSALEPNVLVSYNPLGGPGPANGVPDGGFGLQPESVGGVPVPVTFFYIWLAGAPAPGTSVVGFDEGDGTLSDVLQETTFIQGGQTITRFDFFSDTETTGFDPTGFAGPILTEDGTPQTAFLLGTGGAGLGGTSLEVLVQSDAPETPIPASFGGGLALLLPLAGNRWWSNRRKRALSEVTVD